MSPDEAAVVSAIAAAVSAVVTLIAVGIAAGTLVGARKDAAAAAKQAADDRRERLRPILTPELERELLSRGTFNLVIRNWGKSPARDVRVTFDPAPPNDLDKLSNEKMLKWLYQAYKKPIPLWPPRWKMTNVIRSGHEDIETLNLVIAYAGPDGHPYSETFSLDPTPLLKTTTSHQSDPLSTMPLDERQDAWLKRITHAIEALLRTLR